MSEPQASNTKAARVTWNKKEDEALCDALIEKKDSGKQSDGGWKSSVWSKVEERLSEIDGKGFKSAKKCREHFKNLKDGYADNKHLRDMSGFGWDDEKKKVTAGDKQWKALKKTKAKAKANLSLWRNVPFPLYDKLALLCDGHMADGSRAFHPGEKLDLGNAQDFWDGETSSEEGVGANKSIDSFCDRSQEDDGSEKENVTPATPPSRKRKYAAAENPKRSHTRNRTKSASTTAAEEGIARMADAVSVLTQSFAQDSPQRQGRAVRQLEEDGELDDYIKNEAIWHFEENSQCTITYLALPNKERRISYVTQLINHSRN